MVLKGDMPMEIKWLHNNMPVVSENGMSIMKTSARISTLNIESVRGEHRGNYKCVAKNKAGIDEYSTELNVNGRIHFFKFILLIFFLVFKILYSSSTSCSFYIWR